VAEGVSVGYLGGINNRLHWILVRRRISLAAQETGAGEIVNALKDFCRVPWSKWYVRLALFGPISLWGLLSLLGASRAMKGALEWASLNVSVAMNGSPEAWNAFRHLEWLLKVQEFATELTIVGMPKSDSRLYRLLPRRGIQVVQAASSERSRVIGATTSGIGEDYASLKESFSTLSDPPHIYYRCR
jgi:hypothetical protein